MMKVINLISDNVSNKCLGTDGMPVEFYKRFRRILEMK